MTVVTVEVALAAAERCTCARKYEERSACAAVRSVKTCPCVCHRRDVREAVGAVEAKLPQLAPVVVDTREQDGWTFESEGARRCLGGAVEPRRVTLATGDYSVAGMENVVTIERKSLADFIGTVTQGRERFWEELERMRAIPRRCVIIETTEETIKQWRYRSQAKPASLLWTVQAIQEDFAVPVVWAGSRACAEELAAWKLARAWKKHREGFSL